MERKLGYSDVINTLISRLQKEILQFIQFLVQIIYTFSMMLIMIE